MKDHNLDFSIILPDLSPQEKQLLARVYRFILSRAREKEKIKHDQKGKGHECGSTHGQDAGTNAVSAGKFTA
jgi:hypothetical protein